ncbi:MAG TPA: hypothetical protein VK862_09155, partial [Afifellaceae bacterium]|nr:hypothetical protein [Afifellaceae bacterium]
LEAGLISEPSGSVASRGRQDVQDLTGRLRFPCRNLVPAPRGFKLQKNNLRLKPAAANLPQTIQVPPLVSGFVAPRRSAFAAAPLSVRLNAARDMISQLDRQPRKRPA